VDRTTAEQAMGKLPNLREALEAAEDPLEQAALYLDLQEARQLARVYGIGAVDLRVQTPVVPTVERRSTTPPGWIEAMLRIAVREVGLTGFGYIADAHRHLIDQLGPRRAAEIMFEEGELLGLRLPIEAALILDAAASMYAASNDPFGRFRALTLSAMFLAGASSLTRSTLPDRTEAKDSTEWLLGRQGGRRPVTDSADDAPTSIDLLGQTEAAASAWEDVVAMFADRAGAPRPVSLKAIEDAIAQPTPDGLDRLDDPELGPWIMRLAACLTVAHGLLGGRSAVSSSEVMEAWVERRYGAVTSQGVVLPTEWTHFRTRRHEPRVPAVAEKPTGAAGPDQRAVNRTFRTFLLLLLGLVFGWLFVVFIAWRPLAGSLAPGFIAGMSALELVAWFLLAAAGIGIVVFVGRRAIRWAVWATAEFSLPFARLDLLIERVGQPDVTESPVVATGLGNTTVAITPTSWRAHPKLAIPPYRLEPVVATAREVMVVDDSSTYAELAKRVPDTLVSWLRPPGLQGTDLHVRIMPQEDLQTLPWEAMLTLAVTPERSSPKRATVRVSRVPDAARLVVGDRRKRLSAISVASTETGWALVNRAIERGGRVDWMVTDVFPDVDAKGAEATGSPSPDGKGSADHEIVHILGIVSSDHGGPGLRLAPERTYGSQLAPSKIAPSRESSTSRLLRPSEVRGAFPAARLFILQGLPPEDATQRLASDRQRANLARSFAADLARKGTRVVVVPPLAAALGSDVLARLSDAAADFVAKGAAAIMPRINRIQSDIFERGAAARPLMWEIALGVCVYDLPDEQAGMVPG
jgi:hypothetical protein